MGMVDDTDKVTIVVKWQNLEFLHIDDAGQPVFRTHDRWERRIDHIVVIGENNQHWHFYCSVILGIPHNSYMTTSSNMNKKLLNVKLVMKIT